MKVCFAGFHEAPLDRWHTVLHGEEGDDILFMIVGYRVPTFTCSGEDCRCKFGRFFDVDVR